MVQKLSELHDGVSVGGVGDVLGLDDGCADLAGRREPRQVACAYLELGSSGHVVT